jgi:hypothetical protein
VEAGRVSVEFAVKEEFLHLAGHPGAGGGGGTRGQAGPLDGVP